MSALGALLTAFALVLIVAGGLWAYSAIEQRRREALEALAARRGWSLNITKQSLGQPSIIRLTPRSGPTWTLEMRIFAARSGKPSRSVTQFHAPGTTWEEGLLVAGPQMADADLEFANAALRRFDHQIAQAMLGRLVGAETAGKVPELSGWDTGTEMALFASQDPSSRTDVRDLSKAYADWSALKSGDAGQPILVLDAEGLRLGLGHAIQNATALEGFVDYAIRLNRHFSRP